MHLFIYHSMLSLAMTFIASIKVVQYLKGHKDVSLEFFYSSTKSDIIKKAMGRDRSTDFLKNKL